MDTTTLKAAIVAADTPIDALAIIASADDFLADFVNGKAVEILTGDLPKLAMVIDSGPSIPVSETETIRFTFSEALKYMDEHEPEVADKLSPELRAIGLRLADLIDEGAEGELKGEELANRGVYIDLIANHARTMHLLSNLKLTDAQKESEAGFAAESNDDESDSAS